MKKFQRYSILTCLLLLIGINLIYSQSYNVAYIYEVDSSNGLSYRSFLNANSYPTSLIKRSDIASTNFDNYSLIMIDSRSDNFVSWSTQEVQVIQNLNKPILALGRGGSSFYEVMGLSINWANSWTNPDTLCNFQSCTKIFSEDTSLSVFNTPYNINFPQPPSSPIVQLYYSSAFIAVYKPALSDTVLYVGRQTTDTAHYCIVAEGELYWLWGFDNSPASMTYIGKELFINIVYHLIGGTVGVYDEQSLSVFSFSLNQNYPNPFNPSTTIKFSLPSSGYATLKIYNTLGAEVTVLMDNEMNAGIYEFDWNASGLPSGIYFYQLKTENITETKKMILMK